MSILTKAGERSPRGGARLAVALAGAAAAALVATAVASGTAANHARADNGVISSHN